MCKRHEKIDGITWKQADVRQMNDIPSESVDVAFDKGTLDVWIHGSLWNPPDDVLANTGRYVREVRMRYLLANAHSAARTSAHSILAGLSRAQIRRYLHLHNLPATSLHQASSELPRRSMEHHRRRTDRLSRLFRVLRVCSKKVIRH